MFIWYCKLKPPNDKDLDGFGITMSIMGGYDLISSGFAFYLQIKILYYRIYKPEVELFAGHVAPADSTESGQPEVLTSSL